MTEEEAEALSQILASHYDDAIDEHAYTTKESMHEALVKAFNLGRHAYAPEPQNDSST